MFFEHLLRPCCAFWGRQRAVRACSWESCKCKIPFFDIPNTDVEHDICTYNARAHLMCLALSRLFRNCREMLDPSTLIRFLLYTCNIKVDTLVNQLENKSLVNRFFLYTYKTLLFATDKNIHNCNVDKICELSFQPTADYIMSGF